MQLDDQPEDFLFDRYQITVLELLAQSTSEGQTVNWFEQKSSKYQFIEIHPPNVLDLSEDVEYASQAAIWGTEVSAYHVSF